ncbi:glycine betaine/L-proline ABC transporter ATP-binding protein (plasmid) [Lactiplantibacillus plantarum]|uniref:quaternary amine ABC transporter ATP-binding protein n=1 Tax=Lactiplantibacillus plantarum TaxID=1590 RepID=UPI000350781A|nr:glycine betaine/L-proline ABC transporter ATP-binding protein [Lactiplantibacillus plantarum]AGO09662.1 glycine/betaine/carnitine ABC transporter, ATP-binding subunit(ProV) [Lactiplantibacillus plantarum 16]AUH38676.1 glycine betaine/L-proline ABC transporter ATP-binding protein [Lactiplantibacillus plantarum]MBU8890994.1 glycine betaine/L-proline ABC transporter ATP-binding protein [Lactiplantibacillus plantarum]MCG0628536.1 glycine/betaine/carnitine ABC transporter, ATP-binding subunit(Pro
MVEKVKVKNVTKIFGKQISLAKKLLREGKSKAEILSQTGCTVGVNQASFAVNEGELFVIMGLSGSGKSTIIRMINRLINSTDGDIEIDEQGVMGLSKEELRRLRQDKIGMVFQNFALFPHKSVLQNAAYGLELKKFPLDVRNRKAHEALTLVGLTGYDDQYPDQLSGGMQQRVGLARALANDAEILLMDEAFSALDPLYRKEMQDLLLQIQEKMHKTIIFIGHDLNEALKLGDRIMIMRDGHIEQIDNPEDILTHPANDYVERFIEGVDRTKVLTASSVMTQAQVVNIGKAGPRVALRRMRANDISSIYVVDNDNKFVGFADAHDVSDLIKKGSEDLKSVLRTDVPKTSVDMPINALINDISKAAIPYVVLDDDDHLLGIILRSSVLAAIAGEEVSA